MNPAILMRYILIILLLVPALAYAILPVRSRLRYSVRKTSIISSISLVAIISSLSLLGAWFEFPAKRLFMLGFLPAFALFHMLIKGNLLRKLFCYLNSTMVVTNAYLYGWLLAAPLELENDNANVLLPTSGLLCLLVSLILGTVYFRTLKTKISYLLDSNALDLNWRFAVMIPLGVTLLFYWITPLSAAVVMTGRMRIIALVFLLLGPAVFLLLYQAFWRIAVNLTENAALKEETALMDLERKRFEELRSYMNDTRALRHDFRQHMLVIDEYARNGETEKLTEYISQLTKPFVEHRGSFAANPALDAVASHYDSIAEDQSTRIKWHLELPEELPLAESDFIAIFGNLVENALIAVSQLPENERNVQVSARMLSNMMLGLTVKNPYAGQIKIGRDKLPQTDRAGHGVGLSSVAAAVRRHKGTLDISTDNNIFTAGVLLLL